MLFCGSPAFDLVDRGKLWEALKKKGVNEELWERLREIYRETVSKVKARERLEGNFGN